jgi:hypothetical protein
MKIEINNTRDKIIEQYYTLVNPLLGKDKLGPVEIKVLSKMALIYNTYQHLGDDAANLLLFTHKVENKLERLLLKTYKVLLVGIVMRLYYLVLERRI